MVQLGIEAQHQDKKKKNAMSFARERNQKAVVDYLNSLKQDEKKGKELDKVSGANKVPGLLLRTLQWDKRRSSLRKMLQNWTTCWCSRTRLVTSTSWMRQN